MNDPQVHIERLKQQIADARETMGMNRELADERLKQLAELGDRLRSLNSMSEEKRGALAQLPKVLQSIMTDQNFGIFIVGANKKILLFNAVVQQILGFNLLNDITQNHGGANIGIYLEDRVTPCNPGDRHWDRVIFSDKIEKLYVRHPKVPDGIWIRIQSTALLDETGSSAGAVVLINDVTEQVKIEDQVQKICDTLEMQLGTIEKAKDELHQLANKLGHPAWNGNAEAAAAPPDVAAAEQEVLKTILIVDDIAVNRKLLALQLSKFGYEIDHAEDGKKGYEAVKKKDYGLVLMDLDMPEMNGFEATFAIRQYDSETRQHTPIVAMTSYDREGDRERCLSAGMDDYLSKGVSKKKLLDTIECLIRKKVTVTELPAATESAPVDTNAAAVELVDVQGLQNTYGRAESTEIVHLFNGSMRTLLSGLRLAVDEQDAKSVNHFAYSLKGPCATLGLNSIAKLAAVITSDAEAGNWPQAREKYHSLETRYRKMVEHMSVQSQAEQLSLFA